MANDTGAFELLGNAEAETRLLLHTTGYAIAIPGHPEIIAAPASLPTYDAALQMRDVPVEMGFRMDEVPTGIDIPQLAPALMMSYVQSRAREPDSVQATWLRGRVIANGSRGGMYATYQLAGADDAAMEFLTILFKPVGNAKILAMHMTARYRRDDLTPFGWAHVRNALLFSQSWDPEAYPSTQIWPEPCRFALPSARFVLTDRAMHQAEEKAAEISGLLPGDDTKLAQVLIDFAVGMYGPAVRPSDMLEGDVAQKIAVCVPSRVAEILMRNFHELEYMHDFRGWVWQQYWSVMNRAAAQKTS